MMRSWDVKCSNAKGYKVKVFRLGWQRSKAWEERPVVFQGDQAVEHMCSIATICTTLKQPSGVWYQPTCQSHSYQLQYSISIILASAKREVFRTVWERFLNALNQIREFYYTIYRIFILKTRSQARTKRAGLQMYATTITPYWCLVKVHD